MVFASMRAVRLFLRAWAVIKFVLRATSTLQSTDGELRALRKFYSIIVYWWNFQFLLYEYVIAFNIIVAVVTVVMLIVVVGYL